MTYLILTLLVILYSCTNAPCGHAPHVRFLVLEEPNERRPQSQLFHVVGIIDRLHQLLEIIKGDQLILQVHLIRKQSGHGFLHQLGLGGTAKESCQNLRIETAGRRRRHRRGIIGICWLSGGIRVLNTPLQEIIHARIHLAVDGIQTRIKIFQAESVCCDIAIYSLEGRSEAQGKLIFSTE